MESEFFLNAGGIPQHFDQTQSSSIPSWPPLPPTTEMQGCDGFLSGWEKSTDRGLQIDSALSSLVSSPGASNSNVSNESFMIRELIGKSGNIGGEISPHSQPMLAASYSTNTGNNSTNTSCYSTPLNSEPNVNHDDLHEGFNFPSLLEKPPGAEFAADPGFIQRAAMSSCFGSRSFNGRTNQVGLNNAELAAAYNGGGGEGPLIGNVKLSRVSSSPSLKAPRTQKGNKSLERTKLGNSSSREESTVSEQVTSGGEAGLKELNSRKRKATSRGKVKDPPPTIPVKEKETNDSSETKRSKPNEGNGSENNPVKAEEGSKGGSEEDDDSKPSEPLKDYIHVRARRGQATDSHSLAERIRREKIGERMKLLQDLVPGCNKVTGKALMLDEIINYVQSLQRQVELLSMKVSCVNTTRLDINMESLTSKEISQSNHQLPRPMFPLDSSASAIFGHQPLQNPAHHTNVSNGNVTHCSVDPLDSALCHNPNLLDGFHPTAPQYSAFCEGDLRSIVEMSFGQNPSRETLE